MMPVMRTNNWIPSVFNDLFDVDFMPKANCTAPAINVKESDEKVSLVRSVKTTSNKNGGVSK